MPQTLLRAIRASRGWLVEQNRAHNLDAMGAVVMSLAGAVLLAYSFKATDSEYTVVTSPDRATVAFCVNGRSISSRLGNPVRMQFSRKCPTGDRHALAEITRESPFFFWAGWILLAIAAALQMWIARRSNFLVK